MAAYKSLCPEGTLKQRLESQEIASHADIRNSSGKICKVGLNLHAKEAEIRQLDSELTGLGEFCNQKKKGGLSLFFLWLETSQVKID